MECFSFIGFFLISFYVGYYKATNMKGIFLFVIHFMCRLLHNRWYNILYFEIIICVTLLYSRWCIRYKIFSFRWYDPSSITYIRWYIWYKVFFHGLYMMIKLYTSHFIEKIDANNLMHCILHDKRHTNSIFYNDLSYVIRKKKLLILCTYASNVITRSDAKGLFMTLTYKLYATRRSNLIGIFFL